MLLLVPPPAVRVVSVLVRPVFVFLEAFIIDSGNSNSKSNGRSSGAGGMGCVSAKEADGEDEDSDGGADGMEPLSCGISCVVVCVFPGLDRIESKELERDWGWLLPVVISGMCCSWYWYSGLFGIDIDIDSDLDAIPGSVCVCVGAGASV